MSGLLARLDTLDLGWFVAALFAAIYILEMALFVKARRRTWMEGVVHGYALAAKQVKERDSYLKVPDAIEEAFR